MIENPTGKFTEADLQRCLATDAEELALMRADLPGRDITISYPMGRDFPWRCVAIFQRYPNNGNCLSLARRWRKAYYADLKKCGRQDATQK